MNVKTLIFIIILISLTLLALPVFPAMAAEEIEGISDEWGDDLFETGETSDEWNDGLFETGDMIDEIEDYESSLSLSSLSLSSPSSSSPEDEFLKSEKIEWGGSLTSDFTSRWTLGGDYPASNSSTGTSSEDFDINLGASLFFDARPPDKDFRVFGKVKASYPFESKASTTEGGEVTVNSIQVFELFSDFNWNDRVFFRAGKHTIHWGTGYFFSPADVLNLTSIDPEDPEEQREGPVSLKTHIPVNVHNGYLYLIAHDIDKPDEIAAAPKIEFVIGNTETGIGAYIRKDVSPRGVITMTRPILDFDFFTETVFSYGSDKTFIRKTDDLVNYPLGIKTYTREDVLFFSGTAGFRYINSNRDISFMGQYFYNGEGYKNPDILKDSSMGIASLIGAGQLNYQDLFQPGRHYGAAMINWSSIKDSDFGVSLFWIGNLSDGSGQVKPTFSWNPIDYAVISIGIPVFYGEKGDEYTPVGNNLSFSVEVSLGGGTF